MQMHEISLSELQPGETALVRHVGAAPQLRRRLLDLGLTEGAQAVCLFSAPCGNPHAYWVRGAIIALRQEDAMGVVCTEAEAEHILQRERTQEVHSRAETDHRTGGKPERRQKHRVQRADRFAAAHRKLARENGGNRARRQPLLWGHHHMD